MNETTNETIIETTNAPPANDDALRAAIEDQLSKIRRQSMLLGAQTFCKVVFDKITAAENQPGKMSLNDHKRLIKDIKSFCKTGLSRKVNADGETEPIKVESIDSENSTKLMEETK